MQVLSCITPNALIVANAGDSRAVLCRNGQAVDLSKDCTGVPFRKACFAFYVQLPRTTSLSSHVSDRASSLQARVGTDLLYRTESNHPMGTLIAFITGVGFRCPHDLNWLAGGWVEGGSVLRVQGLGSRWSCSGVGSNAFVLPNSCKVNGDLSLSRATKQQCLAPLWEHFQVVKTKAVGDLEYKLNPQLPPERQIVAWRKHSPSALRPGFVLQSPKADEARPELRNARAPSPRVRGAFANDSRRRKEVARSC